ncbi:MAG: S8 family serine peptidase [Chloroflexota bacterium]|nr:S8 family serine peptidase [Chloroflexota bacterium]
MPNVKDTPIEVAATAIHIEDREDWRETVKTSIESHGKIKFDKFLSFSSIEEAGQELRSISGPTVVFIDLRLEGQQQGNYSGYRWLLEDWRNLLRRNASTELFVISGYLRDEGIRETILHQGIPHNHIYAKGEWPRRMTKFLATLRESVQNMDRAAAENIIQGESGRNIDPYLIHTFRAQEEAESQASSEGEPESTEHMLLPMVLRTKEETWQHQDVPDLRVLGKIGNIFSCLGSMRTVVALERDPQILKVEASRPATGPECEISVPYIKADTVHKVIEEKGDRALIAIIDTGIDVLHETFLDKSGKQTRILSIWDQTDPTGPSPQGFEGGTEHTEADINRYITENKVPGGLVPKLKDHGTHVASIAAGRATSEFRGGVAPEAKLLIVIPRMESAPDRPYSLGYSVSHLTALEYIQRFANNAGLPVVINISQGMNAGAHDGKTNMERGVDEIMGNGLTPGIVVVKSVGNERDKGGHARLQVTNTMRETLRWDSRTEHLGPDTIELWYTASDTYRFRLRNPDEDESDWINVSNLKSQGHFPSGNGYEITLTPFDTDNGDNRLVVTITSGKATGIKTGSWSLTIESDSVLTTGEIHAWLERSDKRPIVFSNHVSEGMTVTVPGTSNYVITVGSIQPLTPAILSEFSAYGPTRDNRQKPDLAAPGEWISAAASRSTNGVRRDRGTSMAAPHVSGAIALLLSRQAKRPKATFSNAAQIQRAITQSCRGYNANWHQGLGFGILDVDEFLKRL